MRTNLSQGLDPTVPRIGRNRTSGGEDSHDLKALSLQATDLVLVGKDRDALALVERFADNNPRYLNALHYAGEFLSWTGSQTRALRAFRRALNLNPEFAPALAGMACSLMSMGRPADVDRVAPLVPAECRTLGMECVRLDRIRRHDGSEAALARVQGLEPQYQGSEIGRLCLWRYYDQIGSFENSIRFAYDVSGNLTDSQRIELAALFIRGKEYESAVDVLARAGVAYNSRHAIIAGIAKYHLGRFEESLIHLKVSIEISPFGPVAAYWAAHASLRCGRESEARDLAVSGFERCPEDVNLFRLAIRLSKRALRLGDIAKLADLRAKNEVEIQELIDVSKIEVKQPRESLPFELKKPTEHKPRAYEWKLELEARKRNRTPPSGD